MEKYVLPYRGITFDLFRTKKILGENAKDIIAPLGETQTDQKGDKLSLNRDRFYIAKQGGRTYVVSRDSHTVIAEVCEDRCLFVDSVQFEKTLRQ